MELGPRALSGWFGLCVALTLVGGLLLVAGLRGQDFPPFVLVMVGFGTVNFAVSAVRAYQSLRVTPDR